METRKIAVCVMVVAIRLFANDASVAVDLQQEAREFAKANSALVLAVANGQVMREALQAVRVQQPGVSSEVAADALNRLAAREVVVAGSVTEVSKPVVSRAKHKVRLMIGHAHGQPINVDCLVPVQSEAVADLLPGRAVAFRGWISREWRTRKSLVGDDSQTVAGARLFARAEHDRILSYLPYVERDLPGDRVVLPRPFAGMEVSERRRSCEMARCAASAYPEKPIPDGYRAMSREDWLAVAKDCGFGDESYSDDGYLILGNGLRGRFLVKTFPRRTVIAWSGCDLDAKGVLSNGLADFATAAKHLLDGDDKRQFEQALAVSRSILAVRKGEVWIVGHSLGGALTTYVALSLTVGVDRLFCASFNGLGIAPTFAEKLSTDAKSRVGQLMVDIYCDQDPIRLVEKTTHHPLLVGRIMSSVHFGRPYYVTLGDVDIASNPGDEGICRAHSIDRLTAEMDAVTPPLVTKTGWTWIWSVVGGVILLGLARVVVGLIRRGRHETRSGTYVAWRRRAAH